MAYFKAMKRTAAFLAACALVCAQSVPALACGCDKEKGKPKPTLSQKVKKSMDKMAANAEKMKKKLAGNEEK